MVRSCCPLREYPELLEGTAFERGPVSASDDVRHHCENHSSGSCPRPVGDDPRQVSWLAHLRLSRLPGPQGPVACRESLRAHSCGSSYGGGETPFRIPF